MGNTNSEPGKEAAKATNGSTKERPDESLSNSQRQSLYENAFNSLKEYPYRDRDHHEDPGPDKGLDGWGQNAGPDERMGENIWVERSQRSLRTAHQDHQLEDAAAVAHNEMVARLARRPEWTVTGSEAPGIRSRRDSTPATSTGPAACSERRSGESNRADLLEAGPRASDPAAEDYCNQTASGRAGPAQAGVHEATYSPPPTASIPAVTPYTTIDVNALSLQAAGAPASCANLAVGGGSRETPGKREATTTLVTTATEKTPDEGRAPIPTLVCASESSTKKASVSGETSQRAAVVVTTKIPPVESTSSSGATRSAAESSPRAVGREAFQKTATAGSTPGTSGLIPFPGAARRATAELTAKEDSVAGGLKNRRQREEETPAGRDCECEEEGEEEVREEEGEEEGELCSLHRGQRVLAWCATCCTAVCRTCVMVEHSLHKLSNGPSPLEQPGGRQGEEEGEEELDWAEWGVTRCLMKHAALAEDLVAMETAIKREKEDAIAAVEEKVGEVVRAVRAAGSRAVAELEGQAASLLEPLLQRRRQLQEWRRQASDVNASCRRLLKDPGRLQSSSVYDDVTSRLEKLVASGSQLARGVEGPTPEGHFRPQLDLSGVLDAQASSTSCHVICRLHGDNLHDDRLSGEEGGRAQTPMSCTQEKVGSRDAETKDESPAPRASSGGTAEEGDADSQPASTEAKGGSSDQDSGTSVDPVIARAVFATAEGSSQSSPVPDGTKSGFPQAPVAPAPVAPAAATPVAPAAATPAATAAPTHPATIAPAPASTAPAPAATIVPAAPVPAAPTPAATSAPTPAPAAVDGEAALQLKLIWTARAKKCNADTEDCLMHSLCVDSLTGQIIIGDLENERLQRYSPDGKFMNQQYLDASPCSIAHGPSALAVVADEDLYIHERGSWAVRRKTWIPHVVAENDEPVPTIVAALSDSTFIVGNLQANKLMHYDSSGNLLKETTCSVQRPIMSIWEDHEKNLLISSWPESAVVKVSPKGKRLKTYKRNVAAGSRWFPNCTVSTKDNFVVVADFRLRDVVVFAPNGRFALKKKVDNVKNPRNLAYDPIRDRIIVSDEDGCLACLQLVHQKGSEASTRESSPAMGSAWSEVGPEAQLVETAGGPRAREGGTSSPVNKSAMADPQRRDMSAQGYASDSSVSDSGGEQTVYRPRLAGTPLDPLPSVSARGTSLASGLVQGNAPGSDQRPALLPLPSQQLPRPPGAPTAAQSSPSFHHPLPLTWPSSTKAPRPQIKVVVRWIWTMSPLGLETKRPAIGALAFNRHTRQVVVTDTNNRSLRCYDAEGYLVRQHSFQDGGVPTSIACAATVMAAVRSGELLLLNAETYAEKAAPVKIQGSQGNSAATAPLVTVLDNGTFALCRLARNKVTFLDCWGTVTSTIQCPARAPLTSISADREDNLVVCSSAEPGCVAVFPQCGGRVQRAVAVAEPLAAVLDRRGFLLAIDGAKESLAVVSPGEEEVLLWERLPEMASPAFLAYDGDQDQLYVASRTGTLACVTLLEYV